MDLPPLAKGCFPVSIVFNALLKSKLTSSELCVTQQDAECCAADRHEHKRKHAGLW